MAITYTLDYLDKYNAKSTRRRFNLLDYINKQSERAAERERRALLATTRDLYALNPTEFEEYVVELLNRRGFSAQHVGGRGDGGIDLYVEHANGERAVVQCKRYDPEGSIGPGIVRELIGTMMREGVKYGYLVTTARFTSGARSEADSIPGYTIRLIDGARLARSAQQIGLPGTIIKKGGMYDVEWT
jgi:restriction endonuclease Mrr